MSRTYQICNRCIMDTSDPEIRFGGQGVCNHCTAAIERMHNQLLPHDERESALSMLVDRIKNEGRGKITTASSESAAGWTARRPPTG